MKILLAYLNFGPYHHARLAACRNGGMDVAGLAMARSQGEYNWNEIEGPELIYAVEARPLETVAGRDWPVLISQVLDLVEPDVCAIAGYSHPAMLALIRICDCRHIPWIMMSDSQEIDEHRSKWLEYIKSRVVGLAATGFVAGEPHGKYLQKLGLSPKQIFQGYDAVDNGHFRRGAQEARSKGNCHRKRLGLPTSYFLASARFIAKKNLPMLIEAYGEYRKRAPSAIPHRHLVLLGDGELRPNLEDLVGRAGFTESVHFLGFKQYEELPFYYGLADAFVHASKSEQWGLVVNEAMASGLPVIVSNRCGCARDLVEDGGNGWTFDPFQNDELTKKLLEFDSIPPEAREAMGRISQQIISNWGLERFTSGLKAAAEMAMAVNTGKARRTDQMLLQLLIRRG